MFEANHVAYSTQPLRYPYKESSTFEVPLQKSPPPTNQQVLFERPTEAYNCTIVAASCVMKHVAFMSLRALCVLDDERQFGYTTS